MAKYVGLVAVAIFCMAALATQAATPEEQKKQEEFKKAFASPDKAVRIKAIESLDGSTDPAVVNLLRAVMGDPERDVRLAAYTGISKFPAHDLSVAQLLAKMFNELKPDDLDTHCDYGKAMANCEFKAPLIEALADYGSKRRYPDLVSTAGVKGATNDPNVVFKKQRAQFEQFLEVFNSVAKADVKAAKRDAPLEIKKWWEQNRVKVMTADRELIEKYKAEDKVRREKEAKPLVPKAPEK
jgi:HEAT repeat protein